MEKPNVNLKDLVPTKIKPCKHLVANATGGASYILAFLLVVFLSNIAHALLRTLRQPRVVAESLVSFFPLPKQESFFESEKELIHPYKMFAGRANCRQHSAPSQRYLLKRPTNSEQYQGLRNDFPYVRFRSRNGYLYAVSAAISRGHYGIFWNALYIGISLLSDAISRLSRRRNPRIHLLPLRHTHRDGLSLANPHNNR